MPTPKALTTVTVGGLLWRTEAIDCFNFEGLLASAGKRGQNRERPGVAGSSTRSRTGRELNTIVRVRLRGDYDDDNAKIGGGVDAWIGNFYSHLGEFRAVTEITAVQDLVFAWPGDSVTVDCQIEDGGQPTFQNPWTAVFEVELTLPDGPLLFEGGS